MWRWVFVAALAAVGCGKDSGSDGAGETPAIVGAWSLNTPTGCVRVMEFAESGEFSTSIICQSGGQAYGQFGAGVWSVDGETLTTEITDFAWCPDDGAGPMSGKWAVDGAGDTKTLTLDTDKATIVYQWLGDDEKDADFSGTLIKGCFDEDGGFTAFE